MEACLVYLELRSLLGLHHVSSVYFDHFHSNLQQLPNAHEAAENQ